MEHVNLLLFSSAFLDSVRNRNQRRLGANVSEEGHDSDGATYNKFQKFKMPLTLTSHYYAAGMIQPHIIFLCSSTSHYYYLRAPFLYIIITR